MTYQVSRNGQLYGPYTFEDLQRYVASGNVTLTDLARAEGASDWVPVSQILGTAAPASAPPYPVPGGYGHSAANAFPDPPNLNWGLELLLGFCTCGIFVIVWNLVIAAWANRVQPMSKALIFYIAATVLIVLHFGGSWGIYVSLLHHHPYSPAHHKSLKDLLWIASWIVRLIARFTLRDTLEQHFNGAEPLGLRLNPVMTFFFGGIYFQYKLNEINRIKQGIRYGAYPR
ncbi:MAG TPA: DUF4339 domain-containing protein [Edaphobacter sp.]|jgi:hypothetical protein|nr:DUF4339 domain-containing protein [Edaphobacter sp.]